MSTATLSVKVNRQFVELFRKFCESHFLQIGKFTEHALREMMEDYALGMKAQKVLSAHQGKTVPHAKYFE